MSTLLLRLAAPLQSWGIDSKFDIRRTGREPSKSGVIGLICAALGIKRDDDEMVSQLATLRFGVRVDKEGHFVRDFHMVRSKKGESYVTNRYYLADAEFLVGFESVDEELLKKIEYALLNQCFRYIWDEDRVRRPEDYALVSENWNWKKLCLKKNFGMNQLKQYA